MFFTFSECIKSGYSFSTVRRLYNQGLRDSRPVFAAVTCLHSTRQSTSGISNHCHERKCRRVLSSSSGSKDKSDKGSGNQWSCPKCGNPCTTVERKFWVTHLLSPGFHFSLNHMTKLLSHSQEEYLHTETWVQWITYSTCARSKQKKSIWFNSCAEKFFFFLAWKYFLKGILKKFPQEQL